MAEKKSLRVAYGEALVELGAKNDEIIAMDADLAHTTMSSMFMDAYPGRFFNFGIAEANLVCAAADLAHSGLIPFASTFALFGTGRAYEQIHNGVAYVNANVKFGLSHSGLCVGEDGGSHQSVEDLVLMRAVPNMTIFTPCDPIETKKAVFAAAKINGPAYIRVTRPACGVITEEGTPFIPGKANIMEDGTDVCLVAIGLMVPEALKTAELLAADGISTAVVNIHTIKPLDDETILKMAKKCSAMASMEEHSTIGGPGPVVAGALAGKSSAKLDRMGVMDKFGKPGKPADLFRIYGLTPENIVAEAKVLLK